MDLQFNSPKEMAKSAVKLFVLLTALALVLRFVFHLFGAESTGHGFVTWLYDTTGVLLLPFRAVYPAVAMHSRYVFEFITLFALMAYMGLGMVAMGLVERWSPKR